jgi:hypothetical protein
MTLIRKTYKSSFELSAIISSHLAQLQEMFGSGQGYHSAFRPDSPAPPSFWSSTEQWDSHFTKFIELTGDNTNKDHISFTYGNGWTFVQAMSYHKFKVWELFFIFDDEIDAMIYKLTYSL